MRDAIPSEELPSLLAKNVEAVIDAMSYQGGTAFDDLVREIVLEDYSAQNDNKGNMGDGDDGKSDETKMKQLLEEYSEAVNLVLGFVETFVEQTGNMDDVYKSLLKKIFTSIAPSSAEKNDVDRDNTSAEMENELDDLLSSSSESYTPGFLRHVEGECRRIESSKAMSPESARMLQVLRLIQTRVLEELGKVSDHIVYNRLLALFAYVCEWHAMRTY